MSYQIVASLDPGTGSVSTQLSDYVRRIAAALPPSVQLGTSGLTDLHVTELGLERVFNDDVPLEALLEKPWDSRLDTTTEVSFLPSIGEGMRRSSSEMWICAANGAQYPDRVPPRYNNHYRFIWAFDERFWSNGGFREREYVALFAELHRSLCRELRPEWMMDGEGVLAGWREQRYSRYLYYRDPLHFAEWFLEAFSAVGQPAAVVAALKEMAARDEVTKETYARLRKAAKREAKAGINGTYRRLRFDERGGVTVEDGRSGWNTDQDFWSDTAGFAQKIIFDKLVERGVVRLQ